MLGPSALLPSRLPHPSGGQLTRLPGRALISFTEGLDSVELGDLLRGAGLEVDREGCESGVPTLSGTRTWARTLDCTDLDDARMRRLVDAAGGLVAWIAPTFQLTVAGQPTFRGRRTVLAALPHRLLVRVFRPEDDDLRERIDGYLRRDGAEPDRKSETGRHLGDHLLYRVVEPLERNAYDIRHRLLEELGADAGTACGFVPAEAVGAEVNFEHMPLHVPTAFDPDDPAYGAQWNVRRIRAGGRGAAWELERGSPKVVVALLDTAVDADGADFDHVEPAVGLDAGAAALAPSGHGTWCAGVAAAAIDNGAGVAGVAGGCGLLPLVFSHWTDVELAVGIRRAAEHPGVRVISLSAGFDGWNPSLVDPAILYAYRRNVVICAAAQNDGLADAITYPATHPLVIACGASGRDDRRAVGHDWASNYGPELSVVAPGTEIPTTDLGAGVHFGFHGTSAATPHVAGVAALLASRHPALCNYEIRAILERTADKAGAHYKAVAGYPNGSRSAELGYGRINARRALERADAWVSKIGAKHACHPEADPGSGGPPAPATLGPVFVLGRGERSHYLDVQPGISDIVRNLLEHRDGASFTGYHQDGAPCRVELEDVDVFDGLGRPLQLLDRGNTVALEVADEQPRQEEVVSRVAKCLAAAEAALQADPCLAATVQGPGPGDDLPRLRQDYSSFQEFGWHVLLQLVRPPWANPGSFWHNLWHALR